MAAGVASFAVPKVALGLCTKALEERAECEFRDARSHSDGSSEDTAFRRYNRAK
jgi:hypothetical protein